MSRRLFFTGGVPADVDNRFTPGSGVGGRSRAVRRALVRRAANSTCCQPGGGASGGHGAPGGGFEPGTNIDVGFWIESDTTYPLSKLQAIFGAQNGADGTAPGLNIKILVLRMNSYARPSSSPDNDTVTTLLNTNNGNFYRDSGISGSFANWVASNPGILDSVTEIWVLPYQDTNSGFDKNYLTSSPPSNSENIQQYMNDLWVAANFINNKWKSLLPSEIANKVKGIVFELENTTMHSIPNKQARLNVNLFGDKANDTPNSALNLAKNLTLLPSTREWSNAGISFDQGAAITGDPSVGNPGAGDFYPPIVTTTRSIRYWKGYARYFPQIYNVGSLMVRGSQLRTNQNFWNTTNQAWQKYPNYSRMFSLERYDAIKEKWDKGAFSSIPSLAGVIQYIRQQGGLGTSVLYLPPNFDYSAPLIR